LSEAGPQSIAEVSTTSGTTEKAAGVHDGRLGDGGRKSSGQKEQLPADRRSSSSLAAPGRRDPPRTWPRSLKPERLRRPGRPLMSDQIGGR
jgi:hypothetical protein